MTFMTTIKQVGGGDTVKAGDTSSVFAFDLLDYTGNKLATTGAGTLLLSTDLGIVHTQDIQVTDGNFRFTLPADIAPGVYSLEIEVDGYVAPTNEYKMTVLASAKTKGKSAEVIKAESFLTAKIEELEQRLAQLSIGGNGASYDDTALNGKISDLQGRIDSLESHEDKDTIYNDEALRERVSALETRVDNDTVYNDEAIKARLSALESRPAGEAVDLSDYLQVSKAYELFPTYATLQAQMADNIKNKHLDLGLDALIDEKLKPYVTKAYVETNYQRSQL